MLSASYTRPDQSVKTGVGESTAYLRTTCPACRGKGEVVFYLDLDDGPSVYGLTCDTCPDCLGTGAVGFWPFELAR